jgi:hypothetical protein
MKTCRHNDPAFYHEVHDTNRPGFIRIDCKVCHGFIGWKPVNEKAAPMFEETVEEEQAELFDE